MLGKGHDGVVIVVILRITKQANKHLVAINHSGLIATKSDAYQFIAFEPDRDSCNFQNGKYLHVWVYGEVTLLLKL